MASCEWNPSLQHAETSRTKGNRRRDKTELMHSNSSIDEVRLNRLCAEVMAKRQTRPVRGLDELYPARQQKIEGQPGQPRVK